MRSRPLAALALLALLTSGCLEDTHPPQRIGGGIRGALPPEADAIDAEDTDAEETTDSDTGGEPEVTDSAGPPSDPDTTVSDDSDDEDAPAAKRQRVHEDMSQFIF